MNSAEMVALGRPSIRNAHTMYADCIATNTCTPQTPITLINNPYPKVQFLLIYIQYRWNVDLIKFWACIDYRIEAGEESIKGGTGSENAIQRNGGDEAQIERRGSGGDHTEGVFNAHEEQEGGEEDAR